MDNVVTLVVLALVVVFVVTVIARTIRIVPQATAVIVERPWGEEMAIFPVLIRRPETRTLLEIDAHLRRRQVTMATVLDEYELVHEGPVKPFHDRVLAELGIP